MSSRKRRGSTGIVHFGHREIYWWRKTNDGEKLADWFDDRKHAQAFLWFLIPFYFVLWFVTLLFLPAVLLLIAYSILALIYLMFLSGEDITATVKRGEEEVRATEGGRYEVFISYRRGSSGGAPLIFNQLLRSLPKPAAIPPSRIFFDAQSLARIDSIEHYVIESRTLVVFLTTDYFRSPYCLLELLVAVENHIPILTVRPLIVDPDQLFDISRESLQEYQELAEATITNPSIMNEDIYERLQEFSHLALDTAFQEIRNARYTDFDAHERESVLRAKVIEMAKTIRTEACRCRRRRLRELLAREVGGSQRNRYRTGSFSEPLTTDWSYDDVDSPDTEDECENHQQPEPWSAPSSLPGDESPIMTEDLKQRLLHRKKIGLLEEIHTPGITLKPVPPSELRSAPPSLPGAGLRSLDPEIRSRLAGRLTSFRNADK